MKTLKNLIASVALIGLAGCSGTKEVCETYQGNFTLKAIGNQKRATYYVFDPNKESKRRGGPKYALEGHNMPYLTIGNTYCFTVRERSLLSNGIIDGSSIK